MSEATQRITVGDTTVTALVESETAHIPAQFFFPDITPDAIKQVEWLGDTPGIAEPEGTIAMRVQAFVVERAGMTVLVDPCVGNGKHRTLPFWSDLALPWLDRFHAAGFTTDAIDLVVHTHLHEDHLGWDTHAVEGEWVPTFVNARHVYVDAELEWAATEERRTGQDPYGDSIAPILAAGLADVVAPSTDLGNGLRLVPTPGHTPGHTSLFVDSGGDGLIVSGDFMHHQVQFADPTLAEVGDVDPGRARTVRAEFIEHCATSGALVAGTHFAVAPFGHVERDAGAWRFTPIPQ